MVRRLCVFVLIWQLQAANSAKILAVFPSYGYSQFFVGQPLLKHLAKRDHEITLISAHKPKQLTKNIEVITAPGILQMSEGNEKFHHCIIYK